MPSSLFRTKPIQDLLAETTEKDHSLKKALRAWDLIAIGIGCIIGVGIFVLPGVQAATHSGPGIILSFVIAALACACSALCYAELAAMIPVSGSAYTYGYTTLGELPGWIIGWDLILEYMVAAIMVSTGWSAYFVNLLNNLGIALPTRWIASPWDKTPGIINLPAVLIVLLLTGLLIRGVKESSRANLVIVIIKVMIILFFIVLAAPHVNPENWKPFMPFGFKGVMTSAAIVFLAFVGFDAVSTVAEETVNPQRDMPVGIMGSLVVATVLYIAVSAIMTGVVHYTKLNVADPVALVLNELHKPQASMVISLGALAGITSVLLVLLMGQPRIFFSMSRDGLLPETFSRVHPRFKTPVTTTLLTGGVVAVAAGLTPINISSELVSIGTLFAFIIVSCGVILLRHQHPEYNRPFKVPMFPALPAIGALLCALLMISLPGITWIRFAVWLAAGLAIYFSYGQRHSRLAQKVSGQPK
ncbi:MAG: amino acid permease [Candidatus Saccharicenans sp.]|jgi:APA family basic amino acid/polyamine antiporter|nr:amino acid permease [Candidatus Saccharicenans sp.]